MEQSGVILGAEGLGCPEALQFVIEQLISDLYSKWSRGFQGVANYPQVPIKIPVNVVLHLHELTKLPVMGTDFELSKGTDEQPPLDGFRLSLESQFQFESLTLTHNPTNLGQI